MTTDLFSDDPSKNVANALDQLVGEGKKFTTVEDLAKGKLESDAFIERLTEEQKALREELGKLSDKAKEAETLKSVLDKLQATKPNTNSTEGIDNQTNLKPEELEDMVSKLIDKRETEGTRKSNRDRANEALLKRFEGDADKAKEYIADKAKEHGMSSEELGALSESSPSAFVTLLGLTKPDSFVGSGSTQASGSKNTSSFTIGGEKNAEYYKSMKSTDKKRFWSVPVQQELIRFGEQNGVDKLREILNS